MTRRLAAAYRGVVCDLDGVVYRGESAIPRAVAALEGLRPHAGVVFATNNASRTVAEVTDQLVRLGLTEPVVCSSAQAAARLLAADCPNGARVLVVGGPGLIEAVQDVGLTVVQQAADEPEAVVQGWGRNVSVALLAEAAIAIGRGARWVATNTDLTLPTAAGLVPGNGTLVAAVAAATGRHPEVVGKPNPPLLAAALDLLQVPASQALAVGDRLDTDIAGAQAVGTDSLWVLTGVHGWSDLATASVTPTYAVPDLSALHRGYPIVQRRQDGWCWEGRCVVRVEPDHDAGLQEAALRGLDDDRAADVVSAVGLIAISELRGRAGGGGGAVAAMTLAARLDAWFAGRVGRSQ